jgi:TnpA family transposase
MSAHRLSYLNRRHVTLENLQSSAVDIINLYHQLTLPRLWGDGSSVGTDGTKYALAENNPMAEYHFRYRDIGGVAYYHIADTYIAIFSRFVPCGTWEAIHIIDGLLNNRSELQPRKVHADTQGQSTTVFALTHLLGIELLPRIRNWKDLLFYKADATTTYKQIERLFGGVIDWDYLERHWQDLMQVVISIQEGKISSEMLLRKLGHESRKNRLYRVFRELGRVIRTLYLLRYISDQELRQEITVGCNKVESYNRFVKWLSFGSESMITNLDPEEAEKVIKYGSLLSNAVILHNVYDMTTELKRLIGEGYPVQAEDLVFLSPYMTGHIKRFGDYVISDGGDLPSLEAVLNWSPPPPAAQAAQNTQPIPSG